MLRHTLLPLVLLPLTGFAVEVQVIANKDSGIAKISSADLEDLYLARKSKLPGGAAATVLTNAAGDESREFLSRFLDRTPASFSAEWKRIVFTGKASPPTETRNDREMVELVRKTPGAIGYVAIGAEVEGVVVVPVSK